MNSPRYRQLRKAQSVNRSANRLTLVFAVALGATVQQTDSHAAVRTVALSGQAAAGTYPFTWTGLTAEGAVEPEGLWRWVVSATDDRGQTSSFERPFSLNTTLGFGEAVPPALSVPRRRAKVVAQFTLSRAASITTRIETLSGSVVRKADPAVTMQAGTAPVSWDGRSNKGASVHSGTFVARMTAFNRWLIDHAAATAPAMALLDTSRRTVDESVEDVVNWVRARLAPAPSTDRS